MSFVEGRSDNVGGTRRSFLQPLCKSTPQPFSASPEKMSKCDMSEMQIGVSGSNTQHLMLFEAVLAKH